MTVQQRLPIGSPSRRALFPRGLSVDQIIRTVPSSQSPSSGDVDTIAVASGPHPTTGVCELPGAAAALSARERVRLVEAMDLIIHHRHRQLDYGHTIDRDLGRDDSDRRLLGLALKETGYTRENVTLRVGGADWMQQAANRAAKSAALLIAFIELMLERQAQLELEPEPAPIEQGELGL